MKYTSNATRVRREVLIRIAQAFAEGTLAERVDRIPLEMRPRRGAATRCCVHKDRAVIKYRCMAALGMRVEDEVDELTPLLEYARQAIKRTQVSDPILTVIDDACSGCVKSRYEVTSACKGCVARPCMMNCPKDAIVVECGQARVDPDKCVNCGKCVQVCPFHAIIRVPIPCEEACPVGAITKDEVGKEHIDYDKCIFCGKCMQACPFGAIAERSQMIDVLNALKAGRHVTALLAPAVVGQFPGELEQIAQALHQLGFDAVVEVAFGAQRTAEQEAQEFVHRMQEGQPMMTTSCCPVFVEATRKHLPQIAPLVSTTPTPMHYAAAWAKDNLPDTVSVFIGPCVAKRHEALADDAVDYVLTFEELGAILVANDIDVAVCEAGEILQPGLREGRGFAVTGGVSKAVAEMVDGGADVQPVLVDGLDRKSIALLKAMAAGKCSGNLVEVMACSGGCVAGPGVLGNEKVASRQVTRLAADSPSCREQAEIPCKCK